MKKVKKLFKLKDPLCKTRVSATCNDDGLIGIRTYVEWCDSHNITVLQDREREPVNLSLFEV